MNDRHKSIKIDTNSGLRLEGDNSIESILMFMQQKGVLVHQEKNGMNEEEKKFYNQALWYDFSHNGVYFDCGKPDLIPLIEVDCSESYFSHPRKTHVCLFIREVPGTARRFEITKYKCNFKNVIWEKWRDEHYHFHLLSEKKLFNLTTHDNKIIKGEGRLHIKWSKTDEDFSYRDLSSPTIMITFEENEELKKEWKSLENPNIGTKTKSAKKIID